MCSDTDGRVFNRGSMKKTVKIIDHVSTVFYRHPVKVCKLSLKNHWFSKQNEVTCKNNKGFHKY